jgi:uncharacterized protein YjbJ (UPF0337 family)
MLEKLFLSAPLLALAGSLAFAQTPTGQGPSADGSVVSMNWDRIEGNWKQLKGKIKENWGQITDDDLDKINGRREQLEGKIQERYGISKDLARK